MENFTQYENVSIINAIFRNVTIVGSQVVNSTIVPQSQQHQTNIWHALRSWKPFPLDALSIVTLLGATQVDRAVGSFTCNWFAQYLPLLGGHVFPSNQFVESFNHGITLYNVTEGVVVTQLAGWFARWLLCQNISAGTNILFTPISHKSSCQHWDHSMPYVFGIFIQSLALVIALMARDVWGGINVVSLIESVIIRASLLQDCRSALDAQVRSINNEVRERCRELEYMDAADQSTTRQRLSQNSRCLVRFQDGSMAYLQTPALYWRACLTQSPTRTRSILYAMLRGLGWLAFSLHILSLGPASFIVQIWTVVVLLSATLLTTYGIGRTDATLKMPDLFRKRLRRTEVIGTMLQATFDTVPLASPDSVDVYAAMQLESHQEQKMRDWGLFPPTEDVKWYLAYRKQKEFYRLPQNIQEARIAEQNENLAQHRRDMKERKRNANDDGEIEIPLLAREDTEEMVEVIERGEPSSSPIAPSQRIREV